MNKVMGQFVMALNACAYVGVNDTEYVARSECSFDGERLIIEEMEQARIELTIEQLDAELEASGDAFHSFDTKEYTFQFFDIMGKLIPARNAEESKLPKRLLVLD